MGSPRTIGFGVQCNAGGSTGYYYVPHAYNTDGSRHKFSYCYSDKTQEGGILVDGQLKTKSSQYLNFPHSGPISIFSGLHDKDHDTTTGAILHSLTFTAFNLEAARYP